MISSSYNFPYLSTSKYTDIRMPHLIPITYVVTTEPLFFSPPPIQDISLLGINIISLYPPYTIVDRKSQLLKFDYEMPTNCLVYDSHHEGRLPPPNSNLLLPLINKSSPTAYDYICHS